MLRSKRKEIRRIILSNTDLQSFRCAIQDPSSKTLQALAMNNGFFWLARFFERKDRVRFRESNLIVTSDKSSRPRLSYCSGQTRLSVSTRPSLLPFREKYLQLRIDGFFRRDLDGDVFASDRDYSISIREVRFEDNSPVSSLVFTSRKRVKCHSGN